MTRDQCIREMYTSLLIGNVITVIIFAFSHEIFVNAFEVISYWIGTWFVATYATWTIIDIIDRHKKCRSARKSICGKRRNHAHVSCTSGLYHRKGRNDKRKSA